MVKVIVAGSRDFNDMNLMTVALDGIGHIDVVVSGTARGADSMGEVYAANHGIEVVRMPAQWDLYGKSAGYRRNEEMAKVATHLVAFWDGKSKGTAHMIELGRKYKLNITVIRF